MVCKPVRVNPLDFTFTVRIILRHLSLLTGYYPPKGLSVEHDVTQNVHKMTGFTTVIRPAA
jgi:hypothetical protein